MRGSREGWRDRDAAQVIQKQLKTWSSASRCTWFTFATLIGESDTRHRDSSGADATRTVFAVWILYCVIIAASYSGALKAFLTLPVYQPPINTLQDVLDSGLPWGMVRPPPKNVSAELIGCRYKSRYFPPCPGVVWRGGGADDGLQPGGFRHQDNLGRENRKYIISNESSENLLI